MYVCLFGWMHRVRSCMINIDACRLCLYLGGAPRHVATPVNQNFQDARGMWIRSDVLRMIHAVASLALVRSCLIGSDVKTGGYGSRFMYCICLRSLMIRHHLLVGIVFQMKESGIKRRMCTFISLKRHLISSALEGVIKCLLYCIAWVRLLAGLHTTCATTIFTYAV